MLNEDEEQKMNLGTWQIRFKSHQFAALFLIGLTIFALFLSANHGSIKPEEDLQKEHQIVINEEQETGNEKQTAEVKKDQARCSEDTGRTASNESFSRCNLFSGRWVFDNISYPMYKERKCSFMLNDYACEKYGRKDSKYQNWRWQPHGCNLPRFNGTALLEKLRGKKLIFVGDSLNKNQWTSMLCLIEPFLPPSSSKLVIQKGNIFTFHVTDYNATIGFYWSPLLVESNCDDPETHRVEDRIIRITSIEKHARHWSNADILIFDSFAWWLDPTMTILWGSFGSSDAIYKRVEMKYRRYEMALNTWSEWLEININPEKTNLFFMSLSPFHWFGESWEEPRNCYNESEPITKQDYRGIATDTELMQIAESTLRMLEKRGLRVEYLNITRLSDYRKDAHPSIFRSFQHPPSEEQRANPNSYSDCAHWCLPGVPDVWNQILYSYIVSIS